MNFFIGNDAAKINVQILHTYINHLRKASPATFSKINECNYEILVFGGTRNFIRELKIENEKNNALRYLSFLLVDTREAEPFIEVQKYISEADGRNFGEKLPVPWQSSKLTIYRTTQEKFVVLVSGEPEHGVPLVALQVISNIWQLDQGNIPIHSAGIIHKKGLYLFSGPSGAGKSTLSILSMEIGDRILDEDQLIIHENVSFSGYSANAWGRSSEQSSLGIKGFFWLIKSDADKIIPLSSRCMSRFIWEQSLQMLGGIIPTAARLPLFIRISEFARSIPGYELHFRKSPDFWKLIDAEIPCD